MVLTLERLRSVLDYDAVTGLFRWRESVARCVRVGALAGSIHPKGYVFIKIDRRSYPAHRLAWLHTFGEWPADQIDHRNGFRSDNRIVNLRACSGAENGQNIAKYKSNRSGVIGVGKHKATGLWRARINVFGKQRHLGLFGTREQAYDAYLAAKAELHQFQPVVR